MVRNFSQFIANKFPEYSWSHLQKDVTAGVIVGIVAIPLAMAFAIASGVKPEYGIYTTIIAGTLISLLGGSRFQIGGPTGAFIPVILGIVLLYGYEDLLIAGMMAGIMLCLMGLFRIGALIKYIPRPVILGFTSGIAVIIFTGQIPNFLGLTEVERHKEFIANVAEIIRHVGSTNVYSIITALLCLAFVLITPKFFPKVPSLLVGLVASTIIATVFFGDRVATIGSTYGNIPNTLPLFRLPAITMEKIQQLLAPAFVIAMLGGIESLLSAVVADRMTNTKHDSNQELIGQGIANIVTPMFGGIPATGAIARTGTNIQSGAVSSLAGIIHGLFVLLTLLVFAPLAGHIPLASMAPILMMIAWNMSEKNHFVHVLKTKKADAIVLVVTFLLTVLADLTIAVGVGLALAVVLFVKRVGEVFSVTLMPLPVLSGEGQLINEGIETGQIVPCLVSGPLFFGTAQHFEQKMVELTKDNPVYVLLNMERVPYMDTTGEMHFRSVYRSIRRRGGKLLIVGMNNELRIVLENSGLTNELGTTLFFHSTLEAVAYLTNQVSATVTEQQPTSIGDVQIS